MQARRPRPSPVYRALWLALALVGGVAEAQRMALPSFDSAAGLPADRVQWIAEDRRGFLWVCTWEGLARFDGQSFLVFDNDDGLPRSGINALVEDARGRIWIALNGAGLARLRESPSEGQAASIEVFSTGDPRRDVVNALCEDDAGALVLGTESGLVRCLCDDAGAPRFELLALDLSCPKQQASARTTDGAVWMATGVELARWKAGRLERFQLPEPSARSEYLCLAAVDAEQLVVGDDQRLWRFELAPTDGLHWSPVELTLAHDQGVRCLDSDDDGSLWVGTTAGLLRRAGEQVELYTTEQGLPDNSIRCLVEDRAERTWIGTWSGGLCAFRRDAPVTWSRASGLQDPDTIALCRSADGRVLASTTNDGLFELRHDGARPLGLATAPRFNRVWGSIVALPEGGWFSDASDGPCFVPGILPDFGRAVRLSEATGVEGIDVPEDVLLDRRGELWFGDTNGHLWHGRMDARGDGRFVNAFEGAIDPRWYDELRSLARDLAVTRRGRVWCGGFGVIARATDDANSRFELLDSLPGVDRFDPRDLCVDSRGRLWVGMLWGGVALCADPDAGELTWRRWRAADGLASDSVFSLAEGRDGRMWIGTSRGLDQLDPDSGELRHWGQAIGLADDLVQALLYEPGVGVWAATPGGVTRLRDDLAPPSSATPATWFTRVAFGGRDWPLDPRGERALGPLELPPGRDALLAQWCAPWLEPDEPLRFQVRLDGADADWSAPLSTRELRWAHLAPGDYRLRVRAVLGGSAEPGAEAELTFAIQPPLWRRPWFVALAIAPLALLAFFLHRLRVRQALALERVRSQIALDLHDDLGAGLTQIAILAEVAKRGAPDDSVGALDQVAELARGARESLGEIVWALDPRLDGAEELVRRMRRLGTALCEGEGLAFDFTAPDGAELATLELAADRRRHLFLIFKEALHNAVRHAGARRVFARVSVEGGRLQLELQDDGRGFDPSAPRVGRGVDGLHARARALGGTLSIVSEPERGTQVRLAAPL